MPIVADPTAQELRDRVRAQALNRPGVYRMVAKGGIVLYVGKSKRLRTRLLGYFRAREEEKAWRIVREARAVDWDYVPSEFAALLLELELIKQYRPPYNVRQKREVVYSFLRISREAAPRLHVVRRIRDEPGRYFGPFQGGKRIADAVKELNDVLQLRDCRRGTPLLFSDQQELFAIERFALCSRYELRRCLAPCAGRCSEGLYQERVDASWRFLVGESDQPLRILEDRMTRASERWEFEHAAAIRERIARLEMLRAEFRRQRETMEELTFLYAVPGAEGDHRVYAIRSGSVRAVYPAPKTPRQRKRLLEQATPHFQRPETETEKTFGQRVEQLLLVGHWFRSRPDERSRTYTRERWSQLPLAQHLDDLPVV
jgi:excinuclease ABC subunit C